MEVAVCAETVAAVPPKRTVTGVPKSRPAMVTGVPPTPDPDAGVTEVTTGAGAGGGATKVKASGKVVPWPSGLVTVTGCAPAAWAGVVTTSEPEVPPVTVAAEPPMATALPPGPGTKPEPASVTEVPPADVPEEGLTLASEGGGARGMTPVEGADAGPVPMAFVAVTLKV
jgi:hypothetical protein